MSNLNPKQLKFIDEYLKHGVGSKAVIAAGWSPTGASVTANKLLKMPKVAAEMARLRSKLEKKSELSAQKVLDELAKLAFSNVQDLYDEQGNLKPIHELPAEVAAAISSIEMGDKGNGVKKLKTHSKLGAIELATKLLGMVKQQEAAQASVTILLSPRRELPAPVDQSQLRPEW